MHNDQTNAAPADRADQLLQALLSLRQPTPAQSIAMRRQALDRAGGFGFPLAARVQRQAARMTEKQYARMARQFARLGRRTPRGSDAAY